MGKKILLIFHLNFLRNDMGCSAYTYEIAKYLKSKGFSIDFLTNTYIHNNFDDFHELNEKEKIVDNFYPFELANFYGIKIGKFRVLGYKPRGDQRIWYFMGIGLFKTNFNFYEKNDKYYSSWVNDQFVEYFQDVINKNHYDYIHVHYIQFADLLKFSKLPKGIKKVYSMQDANYVQSLYAADFEEYLADNKIEQEIKQISLFDKVMAISNDEMHFFRKFLPNKEFHFLPHPLKQNKLPEVEQDVNLLFLGYANPYNLEAVKWFVDNVHPILKNKEKIWIVGKVWMLLEQEAPEYVKKMVDLGINRLDFAQDLDELYSRTKISMVPIFKGTGMKIKTIDSMCRGIPVVSSTLGVDGFPDKNNNGCLVSDEPEIFAQYIDRLLEDEEFYNNTKEKVTEYFEKYLGLEANKKVIDKTFEC